MIPSQQVHSPRAVGSQQKALFKGSACLTGCVTFTLEEEQRQSLVSTLYQREKASPGYSKHGLGFILPSGEILQQTSPCQQKPKECSSLKVSWWPRPQLLQAERRWCGSCSVGRVPCDLLNLLVAVWESGCVCREKGGLFSSLQM